jgi:steroid delta-isomerase-like uncharacterized protein
MPTVPLTIEPVELQEHKELVHRFVEHVWNAKDPAAADAFLAVDYVDHAYQPPNAEGLKQIIVGTRDAFPDYVFTVEDIVAQDDRVVARMTMRGTHRGPFRGTPATGAAVEVAVYRTFRIVEGKIAEHWGLLDTATLLRQIGTAPTSRNACAR